MSEFAGSIPTDVTPEAVLEARFITLDSGQKLFYRANDLVEPPVVLLHGLTQQSRYWERVYRRLERSIIAVDLRGHGMSHEFNSSEDFSIDRVARDIVELLAALGISRAHIVGHSWGASVALEFSRIAADMTLSCVLLDGGAVNPMDLIPQVVKNRDALRSLLTPPTGPFSRSVLELHYGEIDPSSIEKIMAAVEDSYTTSRPDEYVTRLGIERHMRILDELMSYRHKDDLKDMQVPCWIILCHSGDFWDEAKAEATALFVNHPLIHTQNWYGCHHDVPLQRPYAVAELITTVASMTDD